MTAPQGTQEWLQTRLGKITSSTIHKIMSSKENSSTRTRLLQDLIFERISALGIKLYKSSTPALDLLLKILLLHQWQEV